MWLRVRNERGQTEAPFQLLIAAVMLSMLLPIAFYLFQQYQVWESQERVKNNMETLARELETVANLGEGQKYIDVDLSVYGGPNFRVDNFSLYYPSQSTCMYGCHTPHCMLLKPYVEGKNGTRLIAPGLSPVCVRIPFNVEFSTQSGFCSGKGFTDLALDTEESGGFLLTPGVHRIIAIKKGYKVYLCGPPAGGNNG